MSIWKSNTIFFFYPFKLATCLFRSSPILDIWIFFLPIFAFSTCCGGSCTWATIEDLSPELEILQKINITVNDDNYIHEAFSLLRRNNNMCVELHTGCYPGHMVEKTRKKETITCVWSYIQDVTLVTW